MKPALFVAQTFHRLALVAVRNDFERGGDPVALAVLALARERESLAVQEAINALIRARFLRTNPHRRAHYAPDERFQILELQNAVGWSDVDTAKLFLVSAQTIAAWRRELDDHGKDALVAPRAPVNKHSDRVAYLVHALKASARSAGARQLAAMLALVGVVLAPSTVRRILRRKAPKKPPSSTSTSTATKRAAASACARVVTAKHTHHVWHVDFTQFRLGDCAPGVLAPLLNLMVWPMCWHLAVVVDHHSRQLVHFRVFWRQPTGAQLARVLDVAVGVAGAAPKHVVTDRGPQFMGSDFGAWCGRNKTRPRYGAIGQHGSIAIVERFIRTLKQEHLRRVFVPPTRRRITRLIATFQRHYNEHRPHSALAGLTPAMKARGTPHPATTRRYELRPRWPIDEAEADVVVRVDDIDVEIAAFEGQRHLIVLSAHAPH